MRAVTQGEFNALWQPCPGKDFELPACDEGMVLLKHWADNDPVMAHVLPVIPQGATGIFAEQFYRHVARCPKCNEL
jgi:hypothetical protein